MRARLHWVLPEARLAGGQRRPLHVRFDRSDDGTVKIALGIEIRPGVINWQLCLTPEALTAIQERVTWATQQKGADSA